MSTTGGSKRNNEEAEGDHKIKDEISVEDMNDEIEELYDIFSNAFAHINEGTPEKAIVYLRATINECDRMLRGDEETEFPAKFYEIYAQSLFHLPQLSDSDDDESEFVENFMELAKRMIEKSLEIELSWSRAAVKAQILLYYALKQLSNDDQESLAEYVIQFETAILSGIELCDDFNEFLQLIHQYRELSEDAGKPEWAMNAYKLLQGNTADAEFTRDKAVCLMSAANILQEISLTSEEEDSLLESIKDKYLLSITELEKALQQLCEDDTQGRAEVSVLMFECLLNVGNFTTDEEEAKEFHRRSVELYDQLRTNQLACLPDDFEPMVDELRLELKGN